MKKIFTRSLCICMVIALLINVSMVAIIQMLVSEQSHTADSYESLDYADRKSVV